MEQSSYEAIDEGRETITEFMRLLLYFPPHQDGDTGDDHFRKCTRDEAKNLHLVALLLAAVHDHTAGLPDDDVATDVAVTRADGHLKAYAAGEGADDDSDLCPMVYRLVGRDIQATYIITACDIVLQEHENDEDFDFGQRGKLYRLKEMMHKVQTQGNRVFMSNGKPSLYEASGLFDILANGYRL